MINQQELLVLLGAKEVEIFLLRKRIAELEDALKKLPPQEPSSK